MESWQSKLVEAAHCLQEVHRLVVFTGAGVSRESGIATFRDADGAWSKYDPHIFATQEGFRRYPQEVWQWYNSRRREILQAGPNPAHHAIAGLESLIDQVVVVTQNIDGLHSRAGNHTVLELHGSFQKFRCSANCQGSPTPLAEPPLDLESPPPCPHCGAMVRPAVVWFGENLPQDIWKAAVNESLNCDAMLIVGTSGTVEPAASLPPYAKHYGAYVIEINPEPTPLSGLAHVQLSGPAGTVTPALVESLSRLRKK